MSTLVIEGFKGPFDIFDALGIPPKPLYSQREITVAWRTAFKKIHSDKRTVNKNLFPLFPTPGDLNRAKEWLLESPDNVQKAYTALRYHYRSTWNPHAPAGSPEVLRPIPSAPPSSKESLFAKMTSTQLRNTTSFQRGIVVGYVHGDGATASVCYAVEATLWGPAKQVELAWRWCDPMGGFVPEITGPRARNQRVEVEDVVWIGPFRALGEKGGRVTVGMVREVILEDIRVYGSLREWE